MMTEETVYADKAQDVQKEFASNGDLSCHSDVCMLCVSCASGYTYGLGSGLIIVLALLFHITSVS